MAPPSEAKPPPALKNGEAYPGFTGAKAAFFCDGHLLTYLRDDVPGLVWPGFWDLPGGGREGAESPEACLLREMQEEFGLSLPPARLIYRHIYPQCREGLPIADAAAAPSSYTVFFAGRITKAEIAAIRFGEEGQGWQMMAIAAFFTHPRAIPHFQMRVKAAMQSGLV